MDDWKAMKEMDKVLDHLEGRLGRITAVIRRTAVHNRLQASAAAVEDESQEEARIPGKTWKSLHFRAV